MNAPAGSLLVRAGATLAVLVITFVVIAAFVVAPLVEANPQAAIGVPIGAAVVVAVGAVLALRATHDRQDAVEGMLAATAPWITGSLAVVTVALVLLGQSAPYAIGAGLLITTIGWLAVGFLFTQYARADTAQPRNYADLRDRYRRLKADFDVLGSDERITELKNKDAINNAKVAKAEIDAALKSLGSDLGLEGGAPASGRAWVMGTGYIDMWNRLHRGEEALIDLAADGNISASAQHDRLRLDGSNIGHSKELIARLDKAVETLSGEDAAKKVEARRELRNIRRDINTYRDGVWDQMLDARHQLITRMLFTGVVADLLLIVALLVGVDETAILAASVFYLVGAVIGLFSRLQAESSTKSVVDDYGLTDARLMVTPLVSGLAAIAGVVLTARLLLPGSDVLAPPSTDNAGKTLTLASEVRTPPELSTIFDLDTNAAGLIVAAIFGLTPGLVLERLKSEAEKYKSDIQTSTATDAKK